jgi:hypothetical protein
MSKAQGITYYRHGESIRLSDEAVLEEARLAARSVSNEDLIEIVWSTEPVSPKEARRRFQPIYRATHNLVELGALVEREQYNPETEGTETVYDFVPVGLRVPVPSKKGYKAKFEEAQGVIERLKAQLSNAGRVLCAECESLLCRSCTTHKTTK